MFSHGLFAGDPAPSRRRTGVGFRPGGRAGGGRAGFFLLAWGFWVVLAEAAGGPAVSFEREIRPILKAHCFHCHGEGEKLQGGVDLRLRRLMLGPGDSGPVLVPGQARASGLWKMVASGEMPRGEKKLTPAEVALIERWIQRGAPTLRPEPAEVPRFVITEEERGFWAFQPVRRPPVPRVRQARWVATPVDAFLLARLEKARLGPAPAAERPTLIRRVTLDLTGLPPTPGEVDAFVADAAPGAYERVVDRLLDSPRFGERWARHWLDVAGYADSNGGVEADSERGWAWRYRDYVIRSLNADKPFDVFLTEQLAGDELVAPPYGDLAPEALDRLIATGFLRMAPDPTGDGPADAELARNQVMADTLQVVSSSLLGLTVQCAQCHDHRYDPIPQSDYYRLRAVFEPAFQWKKWKNPAQRLVSLMPREDRLLAECIEHAAQGVDAEATRLHDGLIEEFVQKQLQGVPETQREAVMAARRTPAARRTDEHRRLLREFPTFQDHIILGEVNPEGAKRVADVRQRAGAIRAAKPVEPMIHALVEDPGTEVETVVFHRGDPLQPRERVTPGGLAILARDGSADLAPAAGVRPTSGRRLALARSLTDGTHPLTARVLVNRVWHHLFGAGLVGTLGDFGALGERPTHPELLDWLASEWVRPSDPAGRPWSLKRLVRLLVTSSAYRQGTVNAAVQAADPDNRLLGRMRLRRLDAEALRDSVLALSGRLDTNLYGAPVPVAVNALGQVVVGSQARDGNGDPTGVGGLGGAEFRRSIYLQVRRSMPVGVIETFDAPALTPNCEARPVSTVPPQALMLMNDPFVVERSMDLAGRLRREAPGRVREQIRRLWRLVYGVDPSGEEMQRGLFYLAEQAETIRAGGAAAGRAAKPGEAPPDPAAQALASLGQALLGSNRFLYVE